MLMKILIDTFFSSFERFCKLLSNFVFAMLVSKRNNMTMLLLYIAFISTINS